jgi:hypothetical protein
MVRDARLRRTLTMRVYDFAAKKVLIQRSPPQAGVSKDEPHRSCPTKLSSICDSPAASGASRSDSRRMLCPQKFPFDFRRAKMTRLRIPAARFARVVPVACPPLKTEGAGKTGCPHAPVGLRARKVAQRREDHRYRRNHTGLPCAVVYGLLRALPGEPAWLPPSLSRLPLELSAKLSACMGAPGPHDFAVRIDAARQSAPLRPPHSAPRS